MAWSNESDNDGAADRIHASPLPIPGSCGRSSRNCRELSRRDLLGATLPLPCCRHLIKAIPLRIRSREIPSQLLFHVAAVPLRHCIAEDANRSVSSAHGCPGSSAPGGGHSMRPRRDFQCVHFVSCSSPGEKWES